MGGSELEGVFGWEYFALACGLVGPLNLWLVCFCVCV